VRCIITSVERLEKQYRFELEEGVYASIVKEQYNKLLRRYEIELIIEHPGKGTPSRAKIVDKLAELYNKDKTLIIVKKIYSEVGLTKTRVHVHVYDDHESLKLLEPEYMLKRHGMS